MVELVGFFLGTFAPLGFKEQHTGEQCRIGSRHFLSCQQYPAIDIGAFPSLAVGTALRASCIVVDAF